MAVEIHQACVGHLVRHRLIDGAGEVVWESGVWAGVRYQERPPSDILLASGARPVYRTVALKLADLEVIA